jgi:hypothetical protein
MLAKPGQRLFIDYVEPRTFSLVHVSKKIFVKDRVFDNVVVIKARIGSG